METILFGDIFCLVKEYLIPIDLFHLVNTCKKYRKIIILEDIKRNNININIVNRGIINYLYHQNYKFLEAYYYDEENELDDIYFIVNSTRINVSIYKNNNIKKCINDNYDFDICKNICYFYDEVDHN